VRRVTLDSNVIISALNFGGKPLEVLELARAGRIENAISNPIITETSRILYTKLYWDPEAITEAVDQILGFSMYVQAEYSLNVVAHDADDNRILECAVKAGRRRSSPETPISSCLVASEASRS